MKRVFLIPALTVMWSCGHSEPVEKKAAGPAAAPVAVQTVTVESTEQPLYREAMGTVRARTSGHVAARIMGYVREVRVQQGEMVRAGQVLITLDTKDLETAERQSAEMVREAESAVAEVESAIRGAEAQRDLAEVTFKRMKDLFEKKSITNQEFDEAQARVRMAQAGVDTARAKRKQVEARIAQAKEGVKQAANQKEYATIVAPFAGVVAEKRVEAGNLATPGAPLLVLEQQGAFRLEASVDESLLPQVRRGMRLEVRIEALGKDVAAPVVEIVPAVDAATRTATVKLDLPGMADLRSGMSGSVRFGGEKRQVLVLPGTALRREGALAMAMVVEDGVARTRMVTLGERAGDGHVVLSGLQGGEKVIAPLTAAVVDGAKVEVRP